MHGKKKQQKPKQLNNLQNKIKDYLAHQFTVPTDPPSSLSVRPVGFPAGNQPPEDTLISLGKHCSGQHRYVNRQLS